MKNPFFTNLGLGEMLHRRLQSSKGKRKEFSTRTTKQASVNKRQQTVWHVDVITKHTWSNLHMMADGLRNFICQGAHHPWHTNASSPGTSRPWPIDFCFPFEYHSRLCGILFWSEELLNKLGTLGFLGFSSDCASVREVTYMTSDSRAWDRILPFSNYIRIHMKSQPNATKKLQGCNRWGHLANAEKNLLETHSQLWSPAVFVFFSTGHVRSISFHRSSCVSSASIAYQAQHFVAETRKMGIQIGLGMIWCRELGELGELDMGNPWNKFEDVQAVKVLMLKCCWFHRILVTKSTSWVRPWMGTKTDHNGHIHGLFWCRTEIGDQTAVPVAVSVL